MHLAPFLIYVLATLVLTAVTSYPIFHVLEAIGLRDVAFDDMVMRLLKLYALLGLWPLLAAFGLNNRSGWGYGASRVGRGFPAGLAIGAVVGVATMALVVIVLLACGIRVLRPGVELSPVLLAVMVLQSVFVGSIVAVMEETWFRGALHSCVAHVGNQAVAIVSIALIYGAMHFVGSDINIPADDAGWLSGTAVLFTSFDGFGNSALVDSLFGFVAGGLLLGLVRYRTGRVAECIGIHAGWFVVVRILRYTTYPNADASWSFMIGNYNGVVGLLVGLWFTMLAIAYYFRGGRRVSAS